jgi:hypothetical protein
MTKIFRSRVLRAAQVLTIGCTALLASPAQAQVPAYITAKPDAAAKAFSREVAARIFSNALTPMRQQAVTRSQQAIPGFQCPADPQVALTEVIPYPTRPGVVSWIERFVVACTPRTVRSFLLILEGEQPRIVELLPGLTSTDPLLQRDALQGAGAFAAAVRPKDCTRTIVIDTRITAPPDRGHWMERWTVDQCGARAEVEMTFTPSDRGGTNWSASLVK